MRPHLSRLLLFPFWALTATVVWVGDRAAAEDLLLRVNVSQLDYKTTVTLAEVGPSARVKVKMSETLGAIINRQCGRLDEHYLRLLQERASRYSNVAQPMTFQSAITRDEELELPFCLVVPASGRPLHVPGSRWWPTGIQVTGPKAGPGFDWTKSSKPDTGFDWTKSTWPASDWTADIPSTGWTQFKYLPAGLGFEVGLGFAPTNYEGWSVIPLPGGVDRGKAVTQILASLHAVTPPLDPLNSPPPPILADQQNGIRVVSVLDESEDKCPERQMPAGKYPFDAIELVRVLGLNQARGRAKFGGHAEILIADTGLSDEDAGALASALADSGLDARSARQPTADYPRWGHGAYVASAALGGAYFFRFSELMGHPIKIRPINVIQNKDGTLHTKQLQDVIERGFRTSSVINLSISYHREISGLKPILDQHRNALFVVAAGNKPGRVSGEHPAALGGQYPNLIVVGSLNQDGDFETKQSTWSPAHVEIAAPGCRVPVHEHDKERAIVLRSGSSLAAPLVSFTAAILNKYDFGGPADIKTRLLTSADYDLKLNGKVKGNLKLNIARAVAIANDVVETSAHGEPPIYGKISIKSGQLLRLCDGDYSMGRGTRSEPGQGNHSLLSLDVFKEHGVERIFFFYRIHQTGNLESHTCDLDSELAKHEIEIEEQDAGNVIRKEFKQGKIKIAAVRKLVFSLY